MNGGIVMDRRKFIRTIGGSGLVIAASGFSLSRCDQMPESAISPWSGPAPDLPDREWLLSYAILAPNPHNRQPWLADLSKDDEITLFADPERLLPHTDPFGRQVLIGHGTFLELLGIAAREKGYRTKITLFPNGEPAGDSLEIGTMPVARIQLEKDVSISTDPLFGDILNRRSNKEGYEKAYLNATDEQIIESLPLLDGQRTGIATNEADVSPLREFARLSVLKEIETPRTLLESVELTRIGATEIAANPDGIDLNGPLFWWLKRFNLMSKEKAMTPGTLAHQGGIDYAMGWEAVGALAFVVVVTTIFAHGGWYYLIQRYPIAALTPFGLLAPIFGVAFGVVLFSEPITLRFVLGGIVTLAGVAIINLRTAKKTPELANEPEV